MVFCGKICVIGRAIQFSVGEIDIENSSSHNDNGYFLSAAVLLRVCLLRWRLGDSTPILVKSQSG